MTRPSLPPPSDRIRSVLAEAGHGPEAAEALLALDADHFLYVRRVTKGDVPQSLMDEIGSGLEATQFHALSALMRIRFGYGRPAAEATMGLLAEELSLDPSRASRIASDLVDRGLLRRAVSQADGRRSVLEPTEAAFALLDAFLQAKWRRTLRVFASWSAEDIQTFARLFGRYTEGMRAEYPAPR